MECLNCGKQIPDGQSYYCWSFSKEQCSGNVIQVEGAVILRVHCLECGPGMQEGAAKEINAAAQ